MKKIKAAILGTGNIGTDLMFKLLRRSKQLELALFAGIDPQSTGIRLAREQGVETSCASADAILERGEIDLVFDATSASQHLKHAPRFKAAGKIVVDMTPAALGPFVVPCVNMNQIMSAELSGLNVNMITCGGQATIPIVHAIHRVAPAAYAEIVSTIASKSAGPGTRQNIDEFTRTTARGITDVGGAASSKAIILLNPAEPPMSMNCTIYADCAQYDPGEVTASVEEMVRALREYIPGYRLKIPPQFEDRKITTMIEVTGAGDYLPAYAGNLDIMTAAAQAVGERIAGRLLELRGA